MPKVSVLIPVFNAEVFLRESLNSVFAQTFRDFEVLVVDDGSTDASQEILRSFGDSRLRVINNASNRGQVFAMNRGVELASGEYIARLDADDVAMPERLERQVAFLDAHAAVALVGSYAEFIDRNGVPFLLGTVHLKFEDILQNIFTSNCFFHPSVMFRTAVVRDLGGYREASPSEDYDLWLRIIEHHAVANLPEVLIRYRVHPGQLSQRRLRLQRANADRARFEALERCRRAGRLPAPVSAQRATLWDRLKGGPGTVGGDYLGWIEIYRTMGRRDLADALVWPALVSAPLCRQLHHALASAVFGTRVLRKIRDVFGRCGQRLLSLLRD